MVIKKSEFLAETLFFCAKMAQNISCAGSKRQENLTQSVALYNLNDGIRFL